MRCVVCSPVPAGPPPTLPASGKADVRPIPHPVPLPLTGGVRGGPVSGERRLHPPARLAHVELGPVPLLHRRHHTAHVLEAARAQLRDDRRDRGLRRSEEHTSELQSLMRISYAVFCLKKKTHKTINDKYLRTNLMVNETVRRH